MSSALDVYGVGEPPAHRSVLIFHGCCFRAAFRARTDSLAAQIDEDSLVGPDLSAKLCFAHHLLFRDSFETTRYLVAVFANAALEGKMKWYSRVNVDERYFPSRIFAVGAHHRACVHRPWEMLTLAR